MRRKNFLNNGLQLFDIFIRKGLPCTLNDIHLLVHIDAHLLIGLNKFL